MQWSQAALSKVPIIYCYLCVKLLLVRRTSVTCGQFISFCKQLIQVLGQKSGVKHVQGIMIVKRTGEGVYSTNKFVLSRNDFWIMQVMYLVVDFESETVTKNK